MLQRDGHSDGTYRRLRLGFSLCEPTAVMEQTSNRFRADFAKNRRAVRDLHLASDVQIMTGIRLRKIPTTLCQSGQCRHCDDEQREQHDPNKGPQIISRWGRRVDSALLLMTDVLRNWY